MNDPGRMTILIDDLLYLFWINPVSGDMLNVILIPLRFQFPKSHS